VQQLMDPRRGQAHHCGDLPYGQTLPMGRDDGGGTLAIGCREAVRHHPKVLPNPQLPLKALTATVRGDHIGKDANTRGSYMVRGKLKAAAVLQIPTLRLVTRT
jgi:hypothetical protein